jgi:hypothetical protein
MNDAGDIKKRFSSNSNPIVSLRINLLGANTVKEIL